MNKTFRILSWTLGSALTVGGLGYFFFTRTERGFKSVLDVMYSSDFPDVPRITPGELSERLRQQQPLLLLDTRMPEEYAVSHLRNAQLVNPVTFSEDDVYDIDRDREVVVYCSVGYRSAEIVRRMKELGFTNVKNLYGGLFLWYNEERPVYRAGHKVEQIHLYNQFWGQFITREGKQMPDSGSEPWQLEYE